MAQGCPVPQTEKGLVEWLPRYHQWRHKHGKVSPVALPPVDPETMRHKREYAKWRALLAQLEVGVRTKSLISRAEVVDYVAKANITCRTRLNLLVAKMLSIFGNEVAKAVQDEVDAICAAFAQGMDRALTVTRELTNPGVAATPAADVELPTTLVGSNTNPPSQNGNTTTEDQQ